MSNSQRIAILSNNTKNKLASWLAIVIEQYTPVDVDKLKKIQCRAARWVLSDYNRTSSVTQMLNQLSWPTLWSRRNISRLQMLHKILHQDISLSIPPYYQSV